MPRLVLLGLDDSDVDVLSRISALKPRPEVLVAHPDSQALILKLAEISELDTSVTAPEPREDDVVVTPDSRPRSLISWVEPFERLGLRVLPLSALAAGLEEPWHAPPEPEQELNREAGSEHGTEAKPQPEPQPGPQPGPDPEPEPESEPEPARAAVPAEVFTRPEATFRYLIRESLGEDAVTTLWWEGLEDLWVPILWAGDSPWNSTKRVDLASRWGRFGVTEVGGQNRNQDLLEALTRVAEDVAFRNRALWDTQAEKLRTLETPRGETGWKQWADPILEILEPETAWLWLRDGSAWTSLRAWGEGITLDGRLRLSADLLENMFHGKQWERWSPSDEIRLHLVFAEGDHQWRLRLERLKGVMGGEPS